MKSTGYTEEDIERWVPEPAKRPGRTPFARDRARVVHSAGLRRLADKTQVVGPGTDDFVRNRLTHTLEVAQVGRELGLALGCDPDIVDTACLAHDLGHPPFGHNGERVLDELAADIGRFEGNAQTLRLLTRLEAKTPGAGLNLTRASLDAATKYPWPRRPGESKFGVYDDDLEVFDWLRYGRPEGIKCIEAQVMDFADDVAYSLHDVEDGVVSGRIDLFALSDPSVRQEIWQTIRAWYLPDVDDQTLDSAFERLVTFEFWPVLLPYDKTVVSDPGGGTLPEARIKRFLPYGKNNGREALAALKDLTSQLIGRFCNATEHATRAVHGPGQLIRYRADLVVPLDVQLEIAVLKGIAAFFVMSTRERADLHEREGDVIRELVEVLTRRPELLEPMFAADHHGAGDDQARLRVIIDQVASLTDVSALAWHRRFVVGTS